MGDTGSTGHTRAGVCAHACPHPRPPLSQGPCHGQPRPQVSPFWYFAVTFIKDKEDKSSMFVPYDRGRAPLWDVTASPVSRLPFSHLLLTGFLCSSVFCPVWCQRAFVEWAGVCGCVWGLWVLGLCWGVGDIARAVLAAAGRGQQSCTAAGGLRGNKGVRACLHRAASVHACAQECMCTR